MKWLLDKYWGMQNIYKICVQYIVLLEGKANIPNKTECHLVQVHCNYCIRFKKCIFISTFKYNLLCFVQRINNSLYKIFTNTESLVPV